MSKTDFSKFLKMFIKSRNLDISQKELHIRNFQITCFQAIYNMFMYFKSLNFFLEPLSRGGGEATSTTSISYSGKVCICLIKNFHPYNVSSVLWRLFSTLEVVQYIGGCSVHRGDDISTVGDSFSTVGDTFSTVEVVQYSGG